MIQSLKETLEYKTAVSLNRSFYLKENTTTTSEYYVILTSVKSQAYSSLLIENTVIQIKCCFVMTGETRGAQRKTSSS